jgi:hypothetical protein
MLTSTTPTKPVEVYCIYTLKLSLAEIIGSRSHKVDVKWFRKLK